MPIDVVITLTGPDRVGIVEAVTRALLELSGNVETSRMARLGGAFAMLMLVALPEERLGELETAFEALIGEGYKLTWSRTEPGEAEPADRRAYRVDVCGADHEGIIHEIARGLSERGINIESAETEISQAPVSASPLFSMTAVVAVPSRLVGTAWEAEIAEAGRQANVDVTVTEA